MSIKTVFSIAMLSLFSSLLFGQMLTLPKLSPYSKIQQRIGITDITVEYHSPAVRNRTIFGEVVPYGQVWRAGANENTVLRITHDIMIGGKKLKAGAYGLHMIPKEGENWIVIFSNCSTAWGSYTYDPAEDELRMAVSPEPDDFSEWLTYEVSDKGADYMVLSLVWEKIRIPIRIDIDVQSTVVDNLKQELRSGSRFDAAVWDQAARYCLGNNIALEQALEWVNFAISGPIFSARANFPYLRTKSLILEKLGRTEEATAVFQEAMSLPNTEAGDLYQHGRQLIREKQLDKARDFFEKTIDRFPAHWLGEHGLARVFSEIGDFKQAVHHEEKALELAPESSKDVVKTYLQKLKDGKNIN